MYTHRALFHDGNDELVAELVPFVTEGIDAGERVVVVVSSSVGELLREQLRPDPAFDLWSSTDVYTYPVRTLAAYVDTVRAGTEQGRRMRVAGQPIWDGLSPLAIAEWTCVEAACNVVFADSPLLMLCPYDTERLDPSVIAAARRTHSEIHHSSHLAASREFSPFDHQFAVRSSGLPPRPASAEQISIFSRSDLATVISFVEDFARTHDMVLESPFTGYLPPSTSSGAERGLWIAGQKCDLIAVRQHNDRTTVRLHIADYLVASRPECNGIDKLLGVYALGVCNDQEANLVATHLSTCPDCRAETDRLALIVGLMDPPRRRTHPDS